MAEYLIDRAARLAASAQKPQQIKLAYKAIRETVPAPLRVIATKNLENGTLKPEDFLPEQQGASSPIQTGKRVGRPKNADRPFPTSFPAGSGITYDNLFDEHTKRIIEACVRRLRETRLFGSGDLDDCRMELMEALPFMLQGFSPSKAVKDARFRFTSTSLGNLTTAIINRRNAELRQGAPTVSLNEKINEEGELIDALGEKDCPSLCVRDKGLDGLMTLDQLEFLVARMPERMSLLILMKHLLGMKDKDIASRLHVPRGSVNSLLSEIPVTAKRIMHDAEEA